MKANLSKTLPKSKRQFFTHLIALLGAKAKTIYRLNQQLQTQRSKRAMISWKIRRTKTRIDKKCRDSNSKIFLKAIKGIKSRDIKALLSEI